MHEIKTRMSRRQRSFSLDYITARVSLNVYTLLQAGIQSLFCRSDCTACRTRLYWNTGSLRQSPHTEEFPVSAAAVVCHGKKRDRQTERRRSARQDSHNTADVDAVATTTGVQHSEDWERSRATWWRAALDVGRNQLDSMR